MGMDTSAIEVVAVGQAHAAPAAAAGMQVPAQTVVHVAGSVTAEILDGLRASLRAAAAHGFDACVVLIDKDEHRHCLVQLDPAAELFLVAPVRNPLSQWRAVARTIDTLLHTGVPHAIHLHGLLPGAVGVLALHRTRIGVPVYFSLYGFRTLNRLGKSGARALSALRRIFQNARPAPVTYVPQARRALQIWSSTGLAAAADNIPFLAHPRHESAQPLILSGGHAPSARGVENFSQLAVLLGAGENRIHFEWIGRAGATQSLHLKAAGVRVLGMDDDHALHLATGWLYVAPDAAQGFPVTLVSAMALGLPCVAMDCEQHRAVISHGDTGYLCGSVQEFLDCISTLLNDAELRARLGQAARQQAVLRFNAESFGKRLFAAYSLAAMDPAVPNLRGKS
ncbi:glycosyltransferase [Azohydromonas aeria]|uniref:glycosyltransferase n=1 Tax=Azohydromonas aeria TaxID=2590212 RepID=UPI0012F9C302|nr:glycosyltransferase [Azohydromonas aeria]